MNDLGILNTVYPRPPLTDYIKVGLFIGSTIAFILCVFQPFGTNEWQHPNKYLVLFGYGFITSITLVTYYFFSVRSSKKRLSFWTVGRESLDVFLSTLLALVLCNFYRLWLFDIPFSFSGLMYFLGIAGSVAVLPVGAYIFYLYERYKHVQKSELQASSSANRGNLILLGQNKKEKVTTSEQNLLYVKAEDNYLMLYLLKDDLIQTHIIRSTLTQLLRQLDEEMFIKSHRSYIVNKDKILGITGNVNSSKLSLMGTDKKIPVSRSLVNQFRELTG